MSLDSNKGLISKFISSTSSPITHSKQTNKRLTRSTYIADHPSSSNRKRSSSTDSENGWIPPPPLLPLQTDFLITNKSPSRSSSSFIHSINQTNLHTLKLAHFKCPNNNQLASTETPSFRLIQESELISGSKRFKSDLIKIENQNEEHSNSNINLIKKHKSYEMLEKRSKRLEKEKLIHERFKLKSHLNLLRNPTGIDWKTVRSITLTRIKEEERIHHHQNLNLNHQIKTLVIKDGERENEKVERMRWIMIKEAQETLERYDKLLDTRKPVNKARQVLPPPPPPISTTDLQINSPQSTSSTSIITNKRQGSTISDRIVSKRNKSKIPKTEETNTKALHISLKLKPPISKPSSSISKTKIKIKSKETVSSNTRKSKIEIEESSEEEEEEEVDQSSSEEEPTTKRIQRLRSQNPSSKEISIPIEPIKKVRESLYESENLRRLILEEGLIVGEERRRKIGRKVYGFGLKVPELNLIKFETWLIRLKSLSLQEGLKVSPFLNLNEVLPTSSSLKNLKKNPKEIINNQENLIKDELEGKDWIEFEPRLEEIKSLVLKRDEFGMNSKYFNLIDELNEIEDQMKLKGEGKSLRRLMWERVVLKREDQN